MTTSNCFRNDRKSVFQNDMTESIRNNTESAFDTDAGHIIFSHHSFNVLQHFVQAFFGNRRSGFQFLSKN